VENEGESELGKKTEDEIIGQYLLGRHLFLQIVILSKYSRIPPSSAGGMNGLPSPLGGEG